MYRKMHPNEVRLRMPFNSGNLPADTNSIMQKLRKSQIYGDYDGKEGQLIGASLLDHARRSSQISIHDSPLNQLRQFRKEFHENPELLKQLGLDQEHDQQLELLGSGSLGDLEYTKEFPHGFKNTKNNLDPIVSHVSAFGTLTNIKNAAQLENLRMKLTPFFCNLVEKKVNKSRKKHAFSNIKSEYYTKPKKVRDISDLEAIIRKASNRYFFETMQAIMETDTILTEKLKEFYRTNLKRILFNSLKEHKSFQRVWVAQVRETIRKSVVFDVFRRNAYLEKIYRKAVIYHKSRLFSVWKKVSAEDRLQWKAMVEEFTKYREDRLVSSILVELKSNALAGKQERKRDMEAIMQYQKVRLFRIFEFWKSVSLKRKKPVDLTKYKGMNSIPIRVTQKKNIELLDEDISKVLKTRHVATTYKLMHPTLKI